MKTYIFLILFFAICLCVPPPLFAQKKIRTFELTTDSLSMPQRNFYIAKVIDNRKQKKILGYTIVNTTQRVPIDVKNGLEIDFFAYFQKLIPKKTNQKPITVKIDSCYLYEVFETRYSRFPSSRLIKRPDIANEVRGFPYYSYAFVSISFYDENDMLLFATNDIYYRVRSQLSDFRHYNNQKLIILLESVVVKFYQSNWQNNISYLRKNPDATPQNISLVSPKVNRLRNMVVLGNISKINSSKASGWGVDALFYQKKLIGKSDIIVAGGFSFDGLTLNQNLYDGTQYKSVNILLVSPTIAILKRLSDHLYLKFEGKFCAGSEKLFENKGSYYSNSINGGQFTQGIVYISPKNTGFTASVNLYQTFLNSNIYGQDFGIRFNLGIKFAQ